MIFALLGDYIFELLTSPQSINRKSAIVWAEHDLIQGKPLLEHVGSELDEITIDIKFHDKVTNTETQLRKLRDLMLTKEPQALVLGDGDYKGPYVIVDMTDTPIKSTAGGRQKISSVQLTLREWTGEFTPPPPTPGIANGSAILGESMMQTITDTVSTVVDCVQTACSYAQKAAEIYDNVKNIKNNPLALVNSLSDLYVSVAGTLDPLNQLQLLDGIFQNATDIVSITTSAITDFESVIDILTNPAVSTSSVSDKMTQIGPFFSTGMNALTGLKSSVEPLIIQIGTRLS